MKNLNQIFCLFLVLLGILFTIPLRTFSQSATIPININVNGTLTISDAINDSSAGKNPTINVTLAVTPDLGAAAVTGDANFRIRTNLTIWRLTAQRTQEIDRGPTNILPQDIGLLISTQAGNNANPDAGKLISPFLSSTDLSKITVANPVVVLNGQDKTSNKRDNLNANNYFQVNTRYSITPDFFFQPGAWSTIITYSLVSP